MLCHCHLVRLLRDHHGVLVSSKEARIVVELWNHRSHTRHGLLLLLPRCPCSRIHTWHRTIYANHRIYAHPLSRLHKVVVRTIMHDRSTAIDDFPELRTGIKIRTTTIVYTQKRHELQSQPLLRSASAHSVVLHQHHSSLSPDRAEADHPQS